MNFGGAHPAHSYGKISPRCVPVLPAVARLCPDAFPKGPRTGKAPVRGNISPACIRIQLILARYARHVSKKTRRAPLGNTPREHLATLRWPCPCAGAPARATASQDRLSTAWPLLRDAHPSASPIPATRQYLPPVNARHPPIPAACRARCSQRQAADGLRRRSSGAWPAVRPSPEGPPTASSRRAGRQRSAAQNRQRRPQAGPGLRQRCQKRPSKGRVPLGGTIGTPQKIATKVAFLGCPWPSLRQSQFHQPSRSCARSSRSINATQDFSGCHLTSSRQSFSRLCRSVSQRRCRVELSWAALAQFALGPFEIYWSCLGS